MKSDILRKRFGQSRLLNLEALEWLESTMHAKTVRFDIGKGGGTPEVTWEDRCAAVAMIKSKPARALASLLIWGYDQDQFDIIAHHLAGKMAAQCRADKDQVPSNLQIQRMKMLEEEGNYCVVCKSFDHAVRELKWYMGIGLNQNRKLECGVNA